MKSKNNKISIIVSAYNTEKYIEKCILSLLNQKYENIEIIIINDNSKDKTWDVIKNIAKDNNKIVAINNKENHGLSYNRNMGLKKSTGDYIGFIDSDDYISDDYYEKMLNKMLKENADICVCDMNLVYEKNDTSLTVACGGKERIDFINKGLAASCCNKLFKKDIITSYQFSEGKVNEDLAVVLPIVIKSNKVAYENSVAYNYVQRENSIQNSKITDKRFDIFYGVDLTLDRIKDVDNYKEYADSIVFQQLISLFLYVFTTEPKFTQRVKWFRKYSKLIKKYNPKENIYLKDFITTSGRKHRIYYRLLLKEIDLGLVVSATILSFVYDFLKKITTKNVIKKELSIDSLVKAAKKNQAQKDIVNISVVIPNYNYEKFLIERLYSILNQQVRIGELIILDDCSKDNSQQLIRRITNKLEEHMNIRYIFNKENSGSAFKQWQKAFEESSGEYVWIAEADDYCDKTFLKTITKPIKENNEVVISYCDTAFIDKDGNIITRSIKPEIDIMKTNHWDSDFIRDGIDEIKEYAFLNCTIANVSSVIFKNGNYSEYFKEAGKFKQAGDWLFYIDIMSTGKIAYSNKILNYYRLHGNNVSSVMKKQKHIEEIKKIHKQIENKYGLTQKQKKYIEERYEFLKKVWFLEDNFD